MLHRWWTSYINKVREMNEETKKLERQLGWIKEFPHCVYITLIRGDKRPNCNLCNNDFYSVCALENYTRALLRWLDKKNILKYTKKYEKRITKNSTQRLHKVRYNTRRYVVRKMSWTKTCVWKNKQFYRWAHVLRGLWFVLPS